MVVVIVRNVLEQLGSVARGVAWAAPGSPLQATAGAYRSAAAAAVEGWSAAGRLERSYATPWGPSTGQMLVDFPDPAGVVRHG